MLAVCASWRALISMPVVIAAVAAVLLVLWLTLHAVPGDPTHLVAPFRWDQQGVPAG
jgi:hypothetical protein